MAVAVQDVSSAVKDQSSPGTSYTGTGNLTATAALSNPAMTFLFAWDVTVTAVTAKWAAQTMTQIGAATDSTGLEEVQLWGFLGQPTSGNQNLTLTWTGSAAELQIFGLTWTGVTQASFAAAFTHVTQTNNGSLANGATATLNVTSASGNAVVAGFANDFQWATPTPCNQTQLWATNGVAVAACGNRAAGAASVAMTGHNNTTADNYCAIACDIVAAAAGGGSPLRRNSSLSGLGASGPFFHDPLSGKSQIGWRPSLVAVKRKLIVPPRHELRLAA